MKRPIAYLRKSRVTSDRHVSWEVQEKEIREVAARHGDKPELLSDWGKSGRGEKTRLRPEYQRLRKMIENDEVSVLYSYSLSRLARSSIEYHKLAELCRDHGVKVRLCKEGEFDYSTVSGRLTVGILALVAQMEAELAQERAKDTISVRRARGDHVGSAGYGKRLVKGQLLDNPNENIDVIVDAYREAGSFAGAATLLNARKVPTKKANGNGKRLTWDGNTVNRIIRREAPGETVGKRIEPRVRLRGTFKFSRLLVCPCGQVMTGRTTSHTTKYGSYGPYVSYQCYRGRHDPGHPRPYMVSESAIMEVMKAQAARFVPPKEAQEGDTDHKVRALLEERRLRVVDNYEDGVIDKVERDKKLAAINAKVQASEAAARVFKVPKTINWEKTPAAEINEVLRSYWDGVELDANLMPKADGFEWAPQFKKYLA